MAHTHPVYPEKIKTEKIGSKMQTGATETKKIRQGEQKAVWKEFQQDWDRSIPFVEMFDGSMYKLWAIHLFHMTQSLNFMPFLM